MENIVERKLERSRTTHKNHAPSLLFFSWCEAALATGDAEEILNFALRYDCCGKIKNVEDK